MYENKDILIKVLESILDIKIDDIKYLNPNLNRRKFIEKGCNLDLYIKSKDLYLDIEVSTNYEDFIIERNMSYSFKIYCSVLKRGNSYKEYKDVHLINLIFGKKNNIPIRNYYLKDETGKILSKKLLYSEIYVDSLDKKEYNKYRYVRMLNKYSKDINGDEVEMKYKRALKNLEDDNLFEPMFTKEEDELRLRNSYKIHYKELGLKEGEKKGEEKNKIKTAKEMLKDNLPIEQISKYTGLTISKINNLSKQY